MNNKGKLICTKSLRISGLWRFNKYYTDTIYLFIKRYPIMCWKWHGLFPHKEPSGEYEYKYSLSVPYIINKFYDGEYATNRLLETLENSIRQKLDNMDLELFINPEFASTYKMTGISNEAIFDKENNVNMIIV